MTTPTVPLANLACGILESFLLTLTMQKLMNFKTHLYDISRQSYANLSKAPILDLHSLNQPGDRGWPDTKPYAKKIGDININNWLFRPREERMADGTYLLRGWWIRSLDPLALENNEVIDCSNDPHAREVGWDRDEIWRKGDPYTHVKF